VAKVLIGGVKATVAAVAGALKNHQKGSDFEPDETDEDDDRPTKVGSI
jgi:hypothetical protein